MTTYFISYDISHDGLRTKVARRLEAAGAKRLQKSVFLAPRFRAREIQDLRHRLSRLLNRRERSTTDSILCWPVHRPHLSKLVWEGEETFFQSLLEPVLLRIL